MKILLVNKFYYRRGGDCVVVLNTEALLRDMGHEVAVFSMNYPDNLPCEQQDYFASEVQFAGGIGAKVAALRRTLGQGDVVAQFKRLLHDFASGVRSVSVSVKNCSMDMGSFQIIGSEIVIRES